VLAYRLGSCTIELHATDAFAVPSDALIFGANAELRRRVEDLVSSSFEPAPIPPALTRWTCEVARARVLTPTGSPTLPWPIAVSMRYRARSRNPFARFTMPHLTHVSHLAGAIGSVLLWLLWKQSATGVTLIPLSWRNPDVQACAIVSAFRSLATCGFESDLRVLRVASVDGTEWLQRWIEDSSLLARAAEAGMLSNRRPELAFERLS